MSDNYDGPALAELAGRLRARIAALEAALRDACIGHADLCHCAGCALVFASPGIIKKKEDRGISDSVED